MYNVPSVWKTSSAGNWSENYHANTCTTPSVSFPGSRCMLPVQFVEKYLPIHQVQQMVTHLRLVLQILLDLPVRGILLPVRGILLPVREIPPPVRGIPPPVREIPLRVHTSTSTSMIKYCDQSHTHSTSV